MAENLLNPWIREIQQPSILQISTQQQQSMPLQLKQCFYKSRRNVSMSMKLNRHYEIDNHLQSQNHKMPNHISSSMKFPESRQTTPLHISYPNENLQPYHHFKECHQIQKNANFRNSTSCRIFDEVKTCQDLHQPFHTIMQKIAIVRNDPECHPMP